MHLPHILNLNRILYGFRRGGGIHHINHRDAVIKALAYRIIHMRFFKHHRLIFKGRHHLVDVIVIIKFHSQPGQIGSHLFI